MATIDLDVAVPEAVAPALRKAAEQYRESAAELASAWQDKGAGAVWTAYAKILERAADEVDRAYVGHFGRVG